MAIKNRNTSLCAPVCTFLQHGNNFWKCIFRFFVLAWTLRLLQTRKKSNLINPRIRFQYGIWLALTNGLVLQHNFLLLVSDGGADLLYNTGPPTDCTFGRVSSEQRMNTMGHREFNTALQETREWLKLCSHQARQLSARYCTKGGLCFHRVYSKLLGTSAR